MLEAEKSGASIAQRRASCQWTNAVDMLIYAVSLWWFRFESDVAFHGKKNRRGEGPRRQGVSGPQGTLFAFGLIKIVWQQALLVTLLF